MARPLCLRRSLTVFLVGFVVAAGCSDDPTNPTTPQRFTVAAGSPTITLAAGGSTSTFVRATRTSGFTNAISFGVSGVPGPLNVGLQTTVADDSARVNVFVVPNAPNGNYTFDITATALGSQPQRTTITVAVSGSAVIVR